MVMKLSEYARRKGVTYRTAWNWYKAGQIKGEQLPSGTIIIDEGGEVEKGEEVTVIYARVSSHKQREDLGRQVERLEGYCAARGWRVNKVVREVGSGVNDRREKLVKLLLDASITRIVVEHRDRLTRVGFNYLELLLGAQGREIEVMNLADTDNGDLLADLSSIIYSFCARLYGRRRAKAKADLVKGVLEKNG